MQKIDGFLFIKDYKVRFQFDNGRIKLFDDCQMIILSNTEANKNDFLGQKTDGKFILFYLATSIQSMMFQDEGGKTWRLCGNISFQVNHYIDNYNIENNKYSRMVFSFPELNYFIPSCGLGEKDDDRLILSGHPKTVHQFGFSYAEKTINVVFENQLSYIIGNKINAETNSYMVLSFEETNDTMFFADLYRFVSSFFSFICNRLNISIESVVLRSTYEVEIIVPQKNKEPIVRKERITTESIFTPLDNYKEPFENEDIISKTINYGYILPNINELFQLIVDDVVSIQSIHSSRKARNLLDLKHVLQLSSSFERLQRDYLPSISSENTLSYAQEIKQDLNLEEYVQNITGKKKTIVKEIIKRLDDPDLKFSLEEKLCKAYVGYSDWLPLKPILVKWFGEDISSIAQIANGWRNELAHENRNFDIVPEVVIATRLIEHINYCIVLRKAGCSDSKIQEILNVILTR